LGLKKSFGRSNFGRIVMHSKGHFKSKVIYNILSTNFNNFYSLSILLQIKFDIKRTGIIALFNNAMGA
jgi:ribosomal protein L2